MVLDNNGSFENLKLIKFCLHIISFVWMQITDRFWNQFENSLQFLDSLMDQESEMY